MSLELWLDVLGVVAAFLLAVVVVCVCDCGWRWLELWLFVFVDGCSWSCGCFHLWMGVPGVVVVCVCGCIWM